MSPMKYTTLDIRGVVCSSHNRQCYHNLFYMKCYLSEAKQQDNMLKFFSKQHFTLLIHNVKCALYAPIALNMA